LVAKSKNDRFLNGLLGVVGPIQATEKEIPKLGLVVLETAQFDELLQFPFDESVIAKLPKEVTGR